jgi:hypothetical protein
MVRDELSVLSAFLAVAEEPQLYAGGETAGRVPVCLEPRDSGAGGTDWRKLGVSTTYVERLSAEFP